MDSSTANQIITPANQNFFLSPQFPLQRQYEALRAYFVDEEPSGDVARRFGYSAGAFRVLCYQFRHDSQKRASFFRLPQRGPQSSPARDRVRDLAVAMRKRSPLAHYSDRIDHKVCLRFMEAWLEEVERAGLPHGSSFDLDFHSVPANSAQEPLEKHYVSSRSRSQKGILVFLARDAEQRILRYANAGVTKGEQADEILQFVRFWKKRTGKPPAELVFDSQLTTYEKLSELNREGISFITLRRRSDKMKREIYSQPDSAW